MDQWNQHRFGDKMECNFSWFQDANLIYNMEVHVYLQGVLFMTHLSTVNP